MLPARPGLNRLFGLHRYSPEQQWDHRRHACQAEEHPGLDLNNSLLQGRPGVSGQFGQPDQGIWDPIEDAVDE